MKGLYGKLINLKIFYIKGEYYKMKYKVYRGNFGKLIRYYKIKYVIKVLEQGMFVLKYVMGVVKYLLIVIGLKERKRRKFMKICYGNVRVIGVKDLFVMYNVNIE